MRIKRLKLSGFKSFVEPTELTIRDGLTGIVGPNGCGKSNLLEALRWVMGESSPKSVRGSGMEDVIFAGTASRPQREFAEVSLLAEQSEGTQQPAFIANDDDSEIEVTRRIERGAGSAYRANGRDVRAKDVALIFADAATGAHSPALVSQGRIGAIISAKPQERRQMLEEAAGISGLHVRRKDAEQKLRAAQSNLEKLSIMLDDMESRASQLRRQARQAERYKKLSEEITQGEARLIFVKWRAAKSAADAAKSLASSAATQVEKSGEKQEALSLQQGKATKQLASDRAAAMAARDAASDLSEKIITRRAEAEQIRQRLADMEIQASRIAGDSEREDRLTHSAADALTQSKDENESLAAAIEASDAEAPTLNRAVENAEKSLRDSELELAKANAQQAKAQADQRVASAALDQAGQQLDRLNKEAERLTKEQLALGDEATFSKEQEGADANKARLEKMIAEAESELAAIGAKRQDLIDARDTQQSNLADARAQIAAINSERAALEKALSRSSGNKAIDRITAQQGFEHALAAALGDDADAAIGGDALRRWTIADDNGKAAAENTENLLLNKVDAPKELHARLSHVQVADQDDGRTLAPGQRLVTRDGRMRRWDGFISENDGATHAESLLRANRLDELHKLAKPAETNVAKAQAALAKASDDIENLKSQQESARSKREEADGKLRAALRELDRSRDALARLKQARQSLQERSEQTKAEIKSAKETQDKAQEHCQSLPDAKLQGGVVEKLQIAGEAMRQALITAQSALSAHAQNAAQHRERRAAVQSEIRSWQDRAGEAEKRIAEMKKRQTQIAEEQKSLDGKPAAIENDLARLEQDKAALNDRLSALQNAEQESETKLKELEAQLSDASEELSTAREARAGAAARAENEEARRIEMGRISGERFECLPPVLPEKLLFSEDDLDDGEGESTRLDQLQASRERIGPVNLIAADELQALEQERAGSIAESEELTLAINQLRGSIGSLNREGRQRLLEAFDAVDQHFRRLFSTLFNGGQAHLALIDSDDPLEAGLEIYAQPPGKKLQSLTLLSGGEQALTAVALIFALFLTNPAPICVLDEVDAPLDDANIERFCDLLDAMTRETDTRYMIVTHNAVTMSRMHRLFGVTMIEQGVSRLVSVDLGAAEELLAAE